MGGGMKKVKAVKVWGIICNDRISDVFWSKKSHVIKALRDYYKGAKIVRLEIRVIP